MDIGANNAEELLQIRILPYEDRYFQIGKSLPLGDRVAMFLTLVQNLDVFTWSPYEVPGVNPNFIVHKLNVDPLFLPKKQKPKRSAKQHGEAVKEEVEKLKQARAIKEVLFLEWLSKL